MVSPHLDKREDGVRADMREVTRPFEDRNETCTSQGEQRLRKIEACEREGGGLVGFRKVVGFYSGSDRRRREAM